MGDGNKKILRRAAQAYESRRTWAQLMDEVYTYCMPSRRPIMGQQGENKDAKQGNGMEKVFDSTATKAAFRFAGRMSRDVTPPFQRHADLEVGPALESLIKQQVGNDNFADTRAAVEKQLKDISDKGHALLERANFALVADEMYLDLFGGQGAMLMLEDEIDIIKFVSVPAGEVALRENGYGEVVGVYWLKTYEAQQLPHHWPRAALPDDVKKMVDDNPEKTLPIMQATEFDPVSRRWNHVVLFNEKPEAAPLHEMLDMLTSPWLTPRFWKAPGEVMGRGPGMAALPTIKVLNKVQELTLKAAAFAVFGMWTYRNDRVFNPKTARMYPGAMWAVSSNGGPMGAALQRHEVPGRFDVTNIVNQDLREQVKQITFDDALPPDAGAVRSATEIVERMKRLMSDLAGAYPRLLLEIIVPLWRRLIDVMYRRQLIAVNLPLDQLVLKVQISSPIARAQKAQDVGQIVEYLQIMLSLFGMQGTALVAKIEEMGPDIGRMMGISPHHLRDKSERDQLQKMVAQIMAASMQQQQQPAAAPPQQPPEQVQLAAA
jgi:Bacteriophage head to tail connecting protein